MSSDPATDSNLGNATTISRNDSESLGPKFSGLTEELRKQLLKKRTKFQELLNTVKALISERGEVRAMCATISDRRLYHTAMNAEIELLVKLKARLAELEVVRRELELLAEAASAQCIQKLESLVRSRKLA